MADESNVLFMRGNGNTEGETETDNVWDDSALIKAYDKAVNLAKEEVAKRIGIEVQSSQSKQKSQNVKQFRYANKPQKKWFVGSPCRAVYSGDGEVYEATITKIYENFGTCIVKFVGYGNTQKVELSSLLESEGLQSQIAQQKDALAEKCNRNGETICSTDSDGKSAGNTIGEKMECDSETKRFNNLLEAGFSFNPMVDAIPPAPPLPPQLMAKLPENDADALSSMLMSWYISGFHTGYYHGLKHAQNNHQKRRNC